MPLILCVAALLTGAVSSPPEPLLVSAAISLTDALLEVENAYSMAGGGPVRFNFAGSNVLARQIINGAPADLFISADETQMDYADARGAIDRASRVDLLSNRLVIVTPRGARRAVQNVRDLVHLKRIAVADPAAVPAGVYARQFLEKAGVWHGVQSRLVPLGNVRAALAATESGAADAAIVYESDAAVSSRAEVSFVVTGPEAPRIVYPAAVVAASKNRDAAAKFLAFLRGADARAIFRKHKFS